MKRQTLRNARRHRRGSVVVLAAVLMICIMGVLAFAIDIGYLAAARTEVQQSADAAALAACAELIDSDRLRGTPNMTAEIGSARNYAVQYASLNKVCTTAPTVNANSSNSSSGDVVVGYLADPSNPSQAMSFVDPTLFNSVKVTVRRNLLENGKVPLFFARVYGYTSWDVQASATAALRGSFSGFKVPPDGTNLEILPFALDKETWDALLAGSATDSWNYHSDTGSVTAGSDGIKEVNLFPQGTGSPGNRGTVDIGSSNNSTSDIARQIVYGVNASDLSYLGGELKLDANGQLQLNGDTGISAGVKDELASIIGKPRIIPIFQSVSGPGNNATYTIVQFAGVRIMDVKLTGAMSQKRVIIQPANIVVKGGIPSSNGTSSFVYSPVWIVR